MPEEKELTIEEMRSLVSLATLLPALLDKIAAINNEINALKASFTEIKTKFNTNTTAVIEYKAAVEKLIEKQPDIKPLEADLEIIKQAVLSINIKPNDTQTAEQPAPKKKTPPKPQKIDMVVDEDKDKVEEVVDRILAEHKGRKTRVLTLIDIKNGFRVDDVIAAKVIKWFEDHKMYNSKMRILTFPKR